jgi:hypothetical protein
MVICDSHYDSFRHWFYSSFFFVFCLVSALGLLNKDVGWPQLIDLHGGTSFVGLISQSRYTPDSVDLLLVQCYDFALSLHD